MKRILCTVLSFFLTLTFALAASVAGSAVASADSVSGNEAGYASWTWTGAAGAWSGTMQLPGRFPQATITSDSRAGSVGPQTNQWIRPNTAPAQATYGESRSGPGNNFAYLNIRPRNNTLGATSTSTTTYSFDSPTPASGWKFTLGDIDADFVRVSATDANDNPVGVAALGFQGVFNFNPNNNTDTPNWDPSTQTLTGNVVDTDGAAGWFEPQVPLSTLTFEFSALSGQPVFHTWFATKANDISGTISCAADPQNLPDDLQVRLLTSSGTEIQTVGVASDGTYAFNNYLATNDYRVELAHSGPAAVTPESQTVDIRTGNATAVDFEACATFGIAGSISCEDGEAPTGVTVTLTNGNGSTTTVTDADGSYEFGGITPGEYTLTVTVPDGSTATTDTSVDVTLGNDSVTDVNFGLCIDEDDDTENSGNGVLPDGLFPGGSLPGGSLDFGSAIDGDAGSAVGSAVIGSAVIGSAFLPGLDFGSTVPHAPGIPGVVKWHGIKPGHGIDVVLSGPGGCTETQRTDVLGGFHFGDLQAGTYTVTVIAPHNAAISPSGPVSVEYAGGASQSVNFNVTHQFDGLFDRTTSKGANGGHGSEVAPRCVA